MTYSLTSREDFEKVFPGLVQDLTEIVQQYKIPEPALKWFQNVRIQELFNITQGWH